MTKLQVMKPKLPNLSSISKYIRKIDVNRVYSNRGPLLKLYEIRLAKYLGVPHENIVCFSNATLGLQGLINVLDTKSWIMPSFTFTATGLAVLNSKANYRFRDIDLNSWNLNLNSLTNLQETFGILEVLPFGEKFNQNLNNVKNPVIVDAAASLGNGAIDLNCLKPSDAIVFSLQATKVMGCGEGGLALCGSSILANELRKWLNFGFHGSRESVIIGTNAKLSEYSCAVGLASLDNWKNEKLEWKKRNEISFRISKQLKINPPYLSTPSLTPYWIIALKNKNLRDKIQKKLLENNIETRLWWGLGLHKMRIYNQKIHLQNTDLVASVYLGLPLWRDLPIRAFSKIQKILEKELS